MSPARSERAPAATHVRARDLRVGDYVVGEGLIETFKPLEDEKDTFYIRWARSSFYHSTPKGSAIFLVVVDGEQHV